MNKLIDMPLLFWTQASCLITLESMNQAFSGTFKVLLSRIVSLYEKGRRTERVLQKLNIQSKMLVLVLTNSA